MIQFANNNIKSFFVVLNTCYSSMFRRLAVQKVLCSEGSMFRRSFVQKVLCSEGSIFRRFYIQKVLCSEGPIYESYNYFLLNFILYVVRNIL